MFNSNSSSPYDPAAEFYCSAGTTSLSCTLTPYLFDAHSHNYFTPSPFFSSSSSPPSACDLLHNFHSKPVRRAFSTGDLMAASPPDNSIQDAGRVGRYSAEERIKRIERYRNKRNQRNFHKKITYACRKTLADSRPRVRGRFARNGELETETEPEVETETSETSYESYNNHNSSNHENRGSYSNNDNNGGNGRGDWFAQMQAELLATADEGECCYDEDVLANLDSVFSMNLLS